MMTEWKEIAVDGVPDSDRLVLTASDGKTCTEFGLGRYEGDLWFGFRCGKPTHYAEIEPLPFEKPVFRLSDAIAILQKAHDEHGNLEVVGSYYDNPDYSELSWASQREQSEFHLGFVSEKHSLYSEPSDRATKKVFVID